MAILEINLEKPALVEEYRYRGETPTGTVESGRESVDDSAAESVNDSGAEDSTSESSGGKGKLVGLLALAAGVGLLVWKLKSGDGLDQTDFEEFEGDDFESEEYEHGPEPDIGGDESGGAKRKVASALGLVVVVASLGGIVKKVRS